MPQITTILSNLVDVHNRQIKAVELSIENGKILEINETDHKPNTYLLPGFIDAHVHVESSMLIPSEFARIAVTHGTVATISDPHEIANVLGIDGVELMLENAKHTPFYFYFGAPSCVPATKFETAGAEITAQDLDYLLAKPEIVYMAEMMNFPGVIYQDKHVLEKIEVAKKHQKPIDGHAPGLKGDEMKTYFKAGITTDHECFEYDEAREKLLQGVKIMIREGSAARNFETLIPLMAEFPDQIMFCCDDKHPDNLLESHINDHVKRAVKKGYNLFDVIRAASINVIDHYNLEVGQLRVGDSADFIQVDNLSDFNILKTFIKGTCVSEYGKSNLTSTPAPIINQFNCSFKSPSEFKLDIKSNHVRIIEALDGYLITNEFISERVHATTEHDILKIAVVNRYNDTPIATALIKNFGLTSGAIASCVAHDCHNIVVVGTNDEDICEAVNAIIENKGGISLSNKNEKLVLPLPIAGIMTNESAESVAQKYIVLDRRAKELGSKLRAPFMSLSFMALLVIPALKLSDKGLFNGNTFEFTDVELNLD